MRYIPYAVGAFMLLPFFLWAGMFMAFPGPKPGITDAPLAAALVAVSIPLVLFHYIAGLAYVANSMAGQDGVDLPVWGPARIVQRAMAPLTVVISIAALVWLRSAGESLAAALAVTGAGLFMAAVMAVARRPRRSAALMAAPGRLGHLAAEAIGRGVLRLPLIGALLREVARDPHRAAPIIAINTVLALGVLVALFGFTALVVPAMLLVPVMFYLLLSLGAE
jgi:hypothetical protein